MTANNTVALYLEDETIATNGVLALAQGQESLPTLPMMQSPYYLYHMPMEKPTCVITQTVSNPYDVPPPVEKTRAVSSDYLKLLELLACEALKTCSPEKIQAIYNQVEYSAYFE